MKRVFVVSLNSLDTFLDSMGGLKGARCTHDSRTFFER